MEKKIYTLRFSQMNYDIFRAIKSGKKRIETRAATPKNLLIKQGHILRLVCGDKEFKKDVLRVRIFKTIELLLLKYKPEEIHPKIKTKEELTKLYYSFPNYKEKIKKNGIVAFELK